MIKSFPFKNEIILGGGEQSVKWIIQSTWFIKALYILFLENFRICKGFLDTQFALVQRFTVSIHF